ncbi:U3 small nucleolar ribonucleoprotein protein MPP10-like [Ornithodoros turicata]|uniref:U3 small nucleolar ribonucleoprotein protein MPP10-like n=1 Tax=Ornithodoros turicata TaxID=34597 RepID=UPI003138D714
MAAPTEAACFSDALVKFSSFTKNPEKFLGIHDGSQYLHLTKELYDVQARESRKELSSLVIESFDDEQVWQQLELRNGAVLKESLTVVSRLATLQSSPSLEVHLPIHQCQAELSRSSTPTLEPLAEVFSEAQPITQKEPSPLGSLRKTPEDKFFCLADMNAFLDGETVHSSEDSEGGVQYFDDLPSEDDIGKSGKNAKYEDFFDPPGMDTAARKKTREPKENNLRYEPDTDEEGDEEGVEKGIKSSFETAQDMVKKKMTHLEDDNLKEKPWNLQGEVDSHNRPENSLLQEHLQFDHMTRQAPAITEGTTKQLEKIILDRIRDKAWDDVERKHKPVEEPFEFRRRVTLEQEKSKLSLAQVYEQQFLKQNSQEQKEDPMHEEIKALMSNLFTKLDALANFHLLPKQTAPELKIVNNLPSVTVEEVTPVGMSDAQLLAPEEVKEKPRKEVVEEKTKSRRLRERRIKRARRKQVLEDKQSSKQETALLIGSSAKLLKMEKKTVSSSKKFFQELQHKTTKKAEEPAKKKTSREALTLKL